MPHRLLTFLCCHSAQWLSVRAWRLNSLSWVDLGTLPASVYMRMSALKYSDGDVKYSYEVPTRPGRISSTPPHTHLPCAVSQYRPRRTPVRVLSLCKAEERNLTATKWNDFNRNWYLSNDLMLQLSLGEMYRLLSRWINISKPAFPVFYLFIITPYSVFFVAHHGCRIVFQSRLSPNRKSASIYYIWGYSTHTRAEEWLTFCVSERERERKTVKGREKWVQDRERKECDIGNCWRPWFHWRFLWMAAICPCLSWHSNLRAGLKMVGDLFSLLFGMNANSGMAGPTAAFTSFQSRWLKWLCDTACITARSHSRSQSLYFVPYLSPASFFCTVTCNASVYLSAPSLLCDIKPTE